MSAAVLARVRQAFSTLSPNVVLRSADAVHCATAAEIGLARIYSNDRHVPARASHFGLAGIDVTVGE